MENIKLLRDCMLIGYMQRRRHGHVTSYLLSSMRNQRQL